MNSFDMSWVSLAMAVLQISVVIWKGGELSQRVTGLESRVGVVEADLREVKRDIDGVKVDLGELKSEIRADVAFIKGMLTGWKQPPPSELNL